MKTPVLPRTRKSSRAPKSNGEEAVNKITPISIPELEVKYLEITIVGTTPLVVHAWSDKARRQMLGKQTGEASSGKTHKDPVQDCKDCFYHLPDGSGYAVKATALKKCAVAASNDVELQKVVMRRAFHIIGDYCKIDAPPITTPITPEDTQYANDLKLEHSRGASMRQDNVRLSMSTADIRFRPQFTKWRISFRVEYNSRVISKPQLVNLFRAAGFGVGIGEHRPEKDGAWGRFEVA